MLRGEKVGLRAREQADLSVLMAELYNDMETRVRADSRPWLPIPADSKQAPYVVDDLPDTVACFSVVELNGGELAGEAVLWGIDMHNRSAHLGLSLRPAFRGSGLSADVVALLCHYGFVIRGLHRLQIDTLADNEPMRRAARSVGFELEATLREAAWVAGEFVDEVVFGLLAADYQARPTAG